MWRQKNSWWDTRRLRCHYMGLDSLFQKTPIATPKIRREIKKLLVTFNPRMSEALNSSNRFRIWKSNHGFYGYFSNAIPCLIVHLLEMIIRASCRKSQDQSEWLILPRLWRFQLPSGGLTLIVGTQKWGFSCKVQRRPPADIFLNESLRPKTPLRTPCSWPPWPWFSREKIIDFNSFVKNTKLWPSL